MQGLIDAEAELSRLEKELQRVLKEIPRLEAKLDDSGFLAKAPVAVVAKEKTKLQELHAALGEIRSQIERIKRL
jgi:valyl-tRNA synthetase